MDFDIRRKLPKQYDADAVDDYIETLCARFMASPEGRDPERQGGEDFDGFARANFMMQFGFEYCGVSPAMMSTSDLDEVVFAIIPRKVAVGASQAREVVDELRAFWRFGGRQFGLENAAACLDVLDDRSVKRLERKLADPSGFGMAKSFVMEGAVPPPTSPSTSSLVLLGLHGRGEAGALGRGLRVRQSPSRLRRSDVTPGYVLRDPSPRPTFGPSPVENTPSRSDEGWWRRASR